VTKAVDIGELTFMDDTCHLVGFDADGFVEITHENYIMVIFV
jgi:hypothetical protein